MSKHSDTFSASSSKLSQKASPAEVHARCFKILGLLCIELSVPARALFHNSRCEAKIANCRQLAMYLMNVVAQVNLTQVGEFMGRDRTTVSYACQCIEDERDNEEFDAYVEFLEAKLKNAIETVEEPQAAEVSQ